MSSGGSDYRAPVEAPNTLQSMQEVTIVEAVSEGPIGGLYTGDAKSIVLNDTRLLTDDGTYTYQNVGWAQRLGTADQTAYADIDGTENEVSVSVEVTHDYPKASGSGSGTVSRTISNTNCTHVRVTMGVQGLYESLTDEDHSGDVIGASLSYTVTITNKSGTVIVTDSVSRSDKTMSSAQWAKKYTLDSNGPWTVKIEKTYADNSKATLHNDLYWYSYTEIVGYPMIYPHTATMMVKGNAETFGNSIPSRKYCVKGLYIQVPSNYDPDTRTYTGIWDGTFKSAISDNPAWILYDLVSSDRYGLTKVFPSAMQGNTICDKWTLYDIAKLCDETVSDGFGHSEPRFTFNAQVMGQSGALEAIQTICAAFNGMTFWGSGAFMAVNDMPKDPVKIINQDNVIDGKFTYSTGSNTERHSVALVTWYDPTEYGQTCVEYVCDWNLYTRYGYRDTKVTATGCTSRGQAHRRGLWQLYSEREQWQCVVDMGLDAMDLVPGDWVKVSDPNVMGIRYSGRIVSISGTTVILDAAVSLASGETYTLNVMNDTGNIESRTISSTGESATVTIASAFSGEFVDHAVWSISGTDVAPKLYTVYKMEETDIGKVTVTLHEAQNGKYSEIESGVVLATTPGRKSQRTGLTVPSGLAVVGSSYNNNGTMASRLTFSWASTGDPDVALYEAGYQSPSGGWTHFEPKRIFSIDIPAASPGAWLFRVRSAALDGRQSAWAEKSFTLNTISTKPTAPTLASLKAVGGFRNATVSWAIPEDALIGYFEVYMSTTESVDDAKLVGKIYASDFTVSGLGVTTTYWFWVRSVSYADTGIASDMVGPASCVTNALKADDIPTATITESKLVSALSTQIDKIPSIEIVSNEAAQTVGTVDADLSRFVSDVTQALDRLSKTANLTRNVVRDASITVDPSSGKVVIQALENLKNGSTRTIKSLEESLDAHSGEIALKASTAYVNDMAAAILAGLTPAKEWQFDVLEGWTVTGGSVSVSESVATISGTSEMTFISPEIAISAEDNPGVTIRLRRASDDCWGLTLNYTGGSYSVAEPTNPDAWNVFSLLPSKATWKGTITAISFTLPAGTWLIDYVQIGKNPVQERLLGELQAQINTADLRLNSVEAEVELKADKTTVDGIGKRVTAAEGTIITQAGQISLLATKTALETTNARVDTAFSEISALDGKITQGVGQRYNDLDNDLSDLAEAVNHNASRANAEGNKRRNAFATAKQELEAAVKEINGRLVAEAGYRLLLQAVVEENEKTSAAAIEDESKARADADAAEAKERTTLQATVDGNTAAIQTVSSVAAGKAKVYQQTSAPSSANTGDLWIDNNGLIHRYSGGAWASCKDAELTSLMNAVIAQYFVKANANGYVSGFGLYNNGSSSEFCVLADVFKIYNSASGGKKQIFSLDSTTNQLQIAADLIADGSIVGSKIFAQALIQLSGGGKLLIGEGGIIQLGNGGIMIDDESADNPRILCRDTSVTNGDYLEARKGDITTFKYLSGAYREMKSLRKMEVGIGNNGSTVTLPGYWPSQPKIQVSPNALQSYNASYPNQSQELISYADAISFDASSGIVTFIPRAYLQIAAGGGNVHQPVALKSSSLGKNAHSSDYVTLPNNVATDSYASVPSGATNIIITAKCYAQYSSGYSRTGTSTDQKYSPVTVTLVAYIGGTAITLGSHTFAAAADYVSSEPDGQYVTFTATLASGSGNVYVNAYVTADSSQRVGFGDIDNLYRSKIWLRLENIQWSLSASTQLAAGSLNYTAIAE